MMENTHLLTTYPLIAPMQKGEEVIWINPDVGKDAKLPFNEQDTRDAGLRRTSRRVLKRQSQLAGSLNPR